MGLDAQPRLPSSHKVPEYMLDMYHWFRSSLREKNWLDDDSSEHQDAGSSRASTSPNSVIALTSEDLWDIHHRTPDEEEWDEEEAREVAQINSHPRAPSKRRPAQGPRVSIKGSANTIISHKMDNHEDDRANRRLRRSASPSEEPSDEAHLTFAMHLPDGEHLKGAELRLYRRSAFELGPPADTSVMKQTHPPSRSHPLWLLYHWSVRYRADAPSASPSTSNHSHEHALARKYPTGEKSAHAPQQFLKRINVYHLLRPLDELHSVRTRTPTGESEQLEPIRKLIDTQVIDVRESGWLSFDIFPAIDRWVKHPSENFGLLVTLTDVKGRKAASEHSNLVVVNQDDLHVQSTSQQPPEDEGAWHEVQPLVITFSSKQQEHPHDLLQPTKPGRVKREHPRNSKKKSRPRNKSRKNMKKSGSHRDRCSRQLLFFDFQTVGWTDWVVAPPGFQAYFCQGECSYPMESHLNYTNHATIQALVNSVNRAVVPTPCCVPTDLSPITLLYHDLNRKVVLTNYHDMVVEGCGCR